MSEQADLFAAPFVQKGDSFVARDHRGNARPTVEQARAKAASGMRQALEHAQAIEPTWGDRAYLWIIEYAKKHRRFISEECTQMAEASGFASPADPRAWGIPFRRASRKGIIRKIGFGISQRRHLSPTPLWESLVYGG
jgi:hypothetical protein